ncbi:MAG: glycosyltransferase family 2 protein [Lachnospiraceae bacterium]|nr:glycosyltransferase family 2 protein [Lachnospiraceae bacterium]
MKWEDLLQILNMLDFTILLLFSAFYLYQYAYIPISWFKKKKKTLSVRVLPKRYAVLVAARNEEKVIGCLIESIRNQKYPSDLIDVYVMADNCTDHTAEAAAASGAIVYRRFNKTLIGKGYVLHELIEKLKEEGRYDRYEGFFVFDADNVLRPDYIDAMNQTFSEGYEIVTGYRNSKNSGDNWLSAGIGLWFLRESRYLNYPRYLVGGSAAISGTGFMVSRKLLDNYGGWNCFTLTEDLEFTSMVIRDGYRVGFCREAELFDEQPIDFRQSWRQRLRWSRGYLQVLKKHGLSLIKGIFVGKSFSHRFSCYDVTMNILPAVVITILCGTLDLVCGINGVVHGEPIYTLLIPILKSTASAYSLMFVIGAITTITEWKNIYTSNAKKILYMFTFPVFMLTFIPISLQSLVCKVTWKPIEHNRVLKVENIEKRKVA